ncbi:hypothetical protein ACN28G_18040 [Micromonospora sp. WMMA1923]|uniref:hypothetical protein n=1 Tax=Micromonospora sp. WMMA1923 TaxID=3404125 RepID=UPI003B94B4BE
MSIKRWIAGAGLVALTGALGACGADAPATDSTPAQEVALTQSATPPQEATASSSAAPSEQAPSEAAPTRSVAPKDDAPKPAEAVPPVLTGKRWGTIVRVDSFEGGLSLLDGGRLTEVDGDEGRQLFAPTPLGGKKYLIKSYQRGSTSPLCWRVHNPNTNEPLSVRGATCNANDRNQQFVIDPDKRGDATVYLISNQSAYLRTSASNGLIMEELGDNPPVSYFKINDNGAAPRN